MGRPKGSKNKKTVVKKVVKKGKRGRPKGSKNKKTAVKKIIKKVVKKGKRGRPKGSKNKVVTKVIKGTKGIDSIEFDYKPPRSYKFLGNCPKCKGMIGTKDLVSKFIFVCSSCDKRARTNKLKGLKSNLADKTDMSKMTKAEYLETSIAVPHDMPPMNEKNELVNVKLAIDI